MKLELLPYESLGPLSFGMARDQTRSIVGSRFESFKKTEASINETDHFIKEGIFIYYDDTERLSAIEVTPISDVTFNGTSFFSFTTQRLFESICVDDATAFRNRNGFLASGLGISCYSGAFRKNPENPIESILAFKKGYFDSMMEDLLKQRW